MYPTETTPAYRTRAVLVVVLPVLAGLYADIVYGPTAAPSAEYVPGIVGFAAGAVAALMLGWFIGQVVDRVGRRR